ncbi:hypothetical protein SAMCCGM7_Ch3422 [Sinorhizobium americanum CCGM7]|nr:hypothetical protein SAMCCGM7_Ch3422 [Sinorhizobium americanum CCGM7]
MGIALEHPQLLVTRDAADLDHVQPALEQSANALVPQVGDLSRFLSTCCQHGL